MKKYKNSFNHIWSIICSKSSVDKENNNLSLFNIIEQINSPDKKDIVLPIQFDLVTLWQKINEDGIKKADVRIELLDPNYKILTSSNYKLEVPANFKRIRSISHFDSFKITIAGNYAFKILLKEEGESEFSPAGDIILSVN
jgi:hypothetical protein